MKVVSAFLFVLFCTVCRADDVLMKNGMMYKNVTVTIDEESVQIDLGYRSSVVMKYEIEKIVRKKFDLTKETSFGVATGADRKEIAEADDVLTFPDPSLPKPKKEKKILTYPNSGFIAVAVLGAIGAWACFKEASDASSGIDQVNGIASRLNLTANTEELDSRKSTYTWLGVACCAVSLGTLVYGATPVEVTATPNKVNLSFKF